MHSAHFIYTGSLAAEFPVEVEYVLRVQRNIYPVTNKYILKNRCYEPPEGLCVSRLVFQTLCFVWRIPCYCRSPVKSCPPKPMMTLCLSDTRSYHLNVRHIHNLFCQHA